MVKMLNWKKDDVLKNVFNHISGLLKVSRGEELTIIQKDFGSGFTSVRNSENQDGFVPTNMLHIFE